MSGSGEPRGGLSLELEGLEKSFGSKAVLRGVNLTLRPAEFVVVVGKSGCGKSTLLRLIAGLERPSAGSFALDGKPSSGVNPRVRVVFQDHRLLPWKSALDNVLFGLGKKRAPDALSLLEHVGLGDHTEDFPRTLSGGEKQRVSLARALLSQPDLLLFDEPLGALDALTRIGMQGLIERLWQEQRFTALLITHDVDEAIVLADRVVVLRDGVVDLDLEVTLPRPRPRTGAAFDRIKELVLDRILRPEDQPLTPHASKETPWHANPHHDSTSGRSSPLVRAPALSGPGATPPPSSTGSSTQTITSTLPVPSSAASSI